MCALGIRYQNYCSNVARTYLVEPTKDQKKTYEFLLQVQTAVIDAMVVGKPIADAYKAAHDLVQKTRPELASKLTKNMGFGLTIDFREGALLISPKCKLNFEHNMVFNVAVGFDKLTTDREDSGDGKEVYSLLVADTVRIAKVCASAAPTLPIFVQLEFVLMPDYGHCVTECWIFSIRRSTMRAYTHKCTLFTQQLQARIQPTNTFTIYTRSLTLIYTHAITINSCDSEMSSYRWTYLVYSTPKMLRCAGSGSLACPLYQAPRGCACVLRRTRLPRC